MDARDALARYALGGLLETKGRLAEAVAEFKAATQIAPNFADAYSKLGWLYYKQHKISEAAEALTRAVQYGENDSHALHGLGLAKLAEGKKEDALAFLKLAYQHEERPDKKILIRGELIRMGAIPH